MEAKIYGLLHRQEDTEFRMIPDKYVHIGKTVFDTGLPLELLHEYCLDEQALQLNAQNKQLDEQAQQLAAKDQQLEEAEYKISISIYQDLELTKENAVQKLMKKFKISQELAEQKIAMYW